MTRLTWRYRDRELITASSFKLLKAGNMSWILGLDSKSLKQNHSRTSLLTLNNGNSTYVYFRYKLYSYFATYGKKIKTLRNTHNKPQLLSYESPFTSSIELCYHEGSAHAFAFESQFAQNNDPIGKKTGKTRGSAGAFAFAHGKAWENLFTVYLIVDFFISGVLLWNRGSVPSDLFKYCSS